MAVDRVTFGIVTFNRPELCRRLVDSIYEYYPGACVVVADNGWESPVLPRVAKVLQLPADCGLSAARNAIVDAYQTPYLLILDDDFVFTKETQIERLVSVLDWDESIGVAGGRLRVGGQVEGIAGVFGEDASVIDSVSEYECTPCGIKYQPCQFVLNFALFRRDLLSDHRWDESLKLGEHWEFYFRLAQLHGTPVVLVPSVVATHDRGNPTTEYLAMRRRGTEFKESAKKKWLPQKKYGKQFSTPEKRTLARRAAIEFAKEFKLYCVFPICGTLLGMIREGDVIAHDSDVDFGCLELPKAESRRQFKYIESFRHCAVESEQVYRFLPGVKIDLFRFFFESDTAYYTIYPDEFPEYTTVVKRFPAALIRNIAPLEMWGHTFQAFMEPELFLEANYGPNWRKPDPEFSYI